MKRDENNGATTRRTAPR